MNDNSVWRSIEFFVVAILGAAAIGVLFIAVA
jgi:hypothetical protein